MSIAVAARYARAMVELIEQPGSAIAPEEVVAQLSAVEALVRSSPELRNALLSPAVSPSRKRAAAGRLATQLGVAPLVRNFLFVVIDHRRVSLLTAIRAALEAQLDERRGIVRAAIASARPLSDDQRSAIESALGRLTGKKVRGQFDVDEELIGGVVAKIGSRIYDGSVRGELSRIGRLLSSE